MGTLTVEQIISADGYAADEDGGMDFIDLPADEGEGPGVDADQLEFLAGVDGILLGANTYRIFASYWPYVDPADEPVAEPISRLPKHVLSDSLTEAPWGEGRAHVVRGPVASAVRDLKSRHASLVVWGSLTLTDALFAEGLVDVLRLRVVPVLIGSGRSFTPPGTTARLDLLRSTSHPSGHLGLTYRVRGS